MARISLVAAETDRAPGEPIDPLPGARRFHAVVGVEGVWSGDGRYWEPGSYTWRDLPLPFMADDENHFDHEESILVGNIDTMERIGNEIHAWGPYIEADLSTEAGREVKRLQDMIDRGELRGVSADMDDPEWEVIIPAEMLTEGDVDDDGNLHITGAYPKQIYSAVRIIGATALPHPALQDCYVEADDGGQMVDAVKALAASGHHCTGVVQRYVADDDVMVASAAHPWIKPPVCPPAAMFDDLKLEGPTPITVTNDGEYFGHIAIWGQCHIGRYGECITPPASRRNYADFHLGEVVCEDGTRIACGKITLDTGHADLRVNHAAATKHYDDTGTEVAHVRAGEDQWGIWVHGALCPDVTPAQIRKLMASPPSGDWRRISGSMELVHILKVNVPGFPNHREPGVAAKVYEHDGLVASLILTTFVKPAPMLDDDVAMRAIGHIAAAIGRSPQQRIGALRQRVHGGSKT